MSVCLRRYNYFGDQIIIIIILLCRYVIIINVSSDMHYYHANPYNWPGKPLGIILYANHVPIMTFAILVFPCPEEKITPSLLRHSKLPKSREVLNDGHQGRIKMLPVVSS